MQRLSYVGSTGIAVLIIFYVYFFSRERFSTGELVNFSYLWVFLLSYGLFGLIADRVEPYVDREAGRGFGRAVEVWMEQVPALQANRALRTALLVLLLPLVVAAGIVRSHNPPLRSAAASAVALILLTFVVRFVLPAF